MKIWRPLRVKNRPLAARHSGVDLGNPDQFLRTSGFLVVEPA